LRGRGHPADSSAGKCTGFGTTGSDPLQAVGADDLDRTAEVAGIGAIAVGSSGRTAKVPL
jgi:hypothetical protein